MGGKDSSLAGRVKPFPNLLHCFQVMYVFPQVQIVPGRHHMPSGPDSQNSFFFISCSRLIKQSPKSPLHNQIAVTKQSMGKTTMIPGTEKVSREVGVKTLS